MRRGVEDRLQLGCVVPEAECGDVHPDVRAPLLVHDVLGVGRGLLVVDDRRLDVEVDLHQIARVFRDVAVVGDHDRDRIADEAHVTVGQTARRGLRAVGARESGPHRVPFAAEVVGGEHRVHAVERARGFDVETRDVGARHGAAHECRVQRARHGDVVDVRSVAAQQARVFLALDRLADEARRLTDIG